MLNNVIYKHDQHIIFLLISYLVSIVPLKNTNNITKSKIILFFYMLFENSGIFGINL